MRSSKASALSCSAERAWTLLAHTYKAEVTALDNERMRFGVV